jgi:myo-inositol 2-dehydrogenase / D-chiro-inositol 1-dehydrogenase
VTTRIGFIGSGSVADRHARTLLGFPGVAIVGVVSQRPEHARRFADRFSSSVYRSVKALLDKAGCDLVYICVPPDAHGRIEMQVIERALPFFVEKPLANNLTTAQRIARAVEASGVLTATGYHWRYSGSVELARDLLRKHRPLLATARWLDRTPAPAWWRDPKRSGGQVIEQATHLLDVLRFLLGEAEVCGAAGGPALQSGGHGADRAVVSALRFGSGVVGSLICTSAFEQPKQVGVDVACEDLVLRIHEDRLELLDGDAPTMSRKTVWRNEQDPRQLVDAAFLAAVRGVKDAEEVKVPYAEALKTQRLAWAVASAARARRSRR